MLQALAGIGQVVNFTLEVDEVLQIVMDTIVRLTGAERGFLIFSENDALELRATHRFDDITVEVHQVTLVLGVLRHCARGRECRYDYEPCEGIAEC